LELSVALRQINEEFVQLNKDLYHNVKDNLRKFISKDLNGLSNVSTHDSFIFTEGDNKLEAYQTALARVIKRVDKNMVLHGYKSVSQLSKNKDKVFKIAFIDFDFIKARPRDVLKGLKAQHVVIFIRGMSMDVLGVAVKNRFIVITKPFDYKKIEEIVGSINNVHDSLSKVRKKVNV